MPRDLQTRFPWFSLDEIQEIPIESKKGVALISISSIPEDFANPKGFSAVLRLLFDDLTPEIAMSIRLLDGEEVVLFTETHARQIKKFVNEAKKKKLEVWTHCKMGISRSAAVASVLGLQAGESGNEPFEKAQPNKHVFEVLHRELIQADKRRTL
jgi:predicted protein tyrosine phosphatase